MIGDYHVNRCTRQCFEQKRPLREGEWYYSVVLESNDDYERRDYSADSWDGPPDDCVGWWKSRMPRAEEKKLVLAPKEVLIDLLRQMEAFPDKAKTRYLLALMLMRKRLLRPAVHVDPSAKKESTVKSSEPAAEDHCEEASNIKNEVFEVVSDGSQIEIQVCTIAREEADELRDELNELLYCEAEDLPDEDANKADD